MDTIEKIKLVKLCLTLYKYKQKKTVSKLKRLWARKWLLKRNEARDAAHLVLRELKIEDRKAFCNFTRMSVDTFHMLHKKIATKIARQDTVMRPCIPSDVRYNF